MIKILILLISLNTISYAKNSSKIYYSYSGNFKALYSQTTLKNADTIIYLYDEFYDWSGPILATSLGYDLKKHMQTFNKWGYNTLVPLEKFRKSNAIKGAIHHIKTQTHSKNIHIVGMGESAFLSLIVASQLPKKVKSVTIIAPVPINDTGFGSYPNLLRHIDKLEAKVLLLENNQDKKWRVQHHSLLKKIFRQSNISFKVVTYPVNKDWFWSHRNYYMKDLQYFLKNMIK